MAGVLNRFDVATNLVLGSAVVHKQKLKVVQSREGLLLINE